MSLQDVTSDKDKVGELVQKLLNTCPHEDEYTKIRVNFSDGYWVVTRDHK